MSAGSLLSLFPAVQYRAGVAKRSLRRLLNGGEDHRIGDWIQTYSGNAFYPLDPRADEVILEDVAHALSLKCRFGGHCRRFYSVAQHAVLVSRLVPEECGLEALHHDDSEYVLPDVPSPVKPYLWGFKAAELRVARAISEAFGLSDSMYPVIKNADRRILVDEIKALMAPSKKGWKKQPEPFGISIEPWTPEEAEQHYLKRHAELAAARSSRPSVSVLVACPA